MLGLLWENKLSSKNEQFSALRRMNEYITFFTFVKTEIRNKIRKYC